MKGGAGGAGVVNGTVGANNKKKKATEEADDEKPVKRGKISYGRD
jgi:hypothetical protein